jgi:hypothetical protein
MLGSLWMPRASAKDHGVVLGGTEVLAFVANGNDRPWLTRQPWHILHGDAGFCLWPDVGERAQAHARMLALLFIFCRGKFPVACLPWPACVQVAVTAHGSLAILP